MKIIPKYLTGGIFNHFVTFDANEYRRSSRPQQTVLEPRRSSKTSDSKSGQLTEKDFFDMIKDLNVLPNERRKILSLLVDTFSEESLIGLDSSDIKLMYLSALDSISLAKYNTDIFKNIRESLSTKDAYGDPAITSDGKVVVVNSKGDVGYVTANEYLKDRNKYSIVSNQVLAEMRENSGSFVGDYKSLGILENAVSAKTFYDYIDKAKISLKNQENSYEGFFSVLNGKVAQGLELLSQLSKDDQVKALGAVTADGLYEYEIIDKTKRDLIDTAVSYLVSTMPLNVKTWALLKTGLGKDAVKTLVETYLLSGSEDVHQIKIDYKGSMKKVTKGEGAEDSSVDKLKLNTAGQFYLGYGAKEQFIVNPGTKFNIAVNSTTMPLTDMSGDNLGSMCLLSEVDKGEYRGMLDLSNITMGNTKIPILSLDKIVIEDGNAYSINMPLNQDGKPNFKPAAKANLDKAMKELELNNINLDNPESVQSNINKINEIMEKYELPLMYNSNGKLIAGNWGRFMVLNGLAFEPELGLEESGGDSLLVEETDENLANSVKEVIETKLKLKYDVDPKGSFDWLGYEELYKGTIWIPIKDNFFNVMGKEDLTVNLSLEIADLIYRDSVQKRYRKGVEI